MGMKEKRKETKKLKRKRDGNKRKKAIKEIEKSK